MYELIISNYVNNLTYENINNFALNNNIILNKKELDYIYKTIKSNYKTLLSDEYEIILNNSKDYLSKDNFLKIYNLFINYREKYINLLK